MGDIEISEDQVENITKHIESVERFEIEYESVKIDTSRSPEEIYKKTMKSFYETPHWILREGVMNFKRDNVTIITQP